MALTESEKRQLLELGQPYSDAPAFEQQIRDKGILTSDLLKTQPDLSKALTFVNPNQDLFPVGSLNVEVPQAEPTVPEAKADVFSERLQRINEQLLGQEALRMEKEKEAGIPELQKTQSELAGRVKQLQAEALAIPISIQTEFTGRGVTAAGIAPIQTARLRENAIKALTISALLEASKGQLATAFEQVDRAVEQRFEPLREEAVALEKNLQLILQSPAYSLAEKNRANQQLQAQKDRERLLDRQEIEQKTILNTAVEAARNGADSLTLRKIQKATTVAEALEIATPFMRKEETTGALSDFEAAFQRQYGRLPSVDELTKFKQSTQTTFLTATGAIDRVLTPQEQELYGVPSGTRLGEVQGQIPIAPAQRERLTSFTQALPIVEAIRSMAGQLDLADNTIGTVLRGTKLKARSLLPSTIEGQYESQKRSFLTLLSRAAGERGVVTDQDVNRIAGNIPGFFDTKKSAQAKLERFSNILKEVQARAAAGYIGNPLNQGSPVNQVDPLSLFR